MIRYDLHKISLALGLSHLHLYLVCSAPKPKHSTSFPNRYSLLTLPFHTSIVQTPMWCEHFAMYRYNISSSSTRFNQNVYE